MSLFNLEPVQPHRQDSTFPEVAHPVLASDARAWFYRQRGWAWFIADVNGSVDWDVRPDFDGPFPVWFGWITEEASWQDRLFGNSAAEMMLQNGIAPGQPFRIAFAWSCGVDYSQCWTGEGWDELEWELVEVEPLDARESARRWEDWLNAWGAAP